MKMRLLFVLFIIGLAITSCRKKDRQDPNAYLRFTQSTVELPFSAAVKGYVAVESNTAWDLTVSADWLSLSKTSGNGNDTIYISVTRDDQSASQRSATIVAKGSGHEARVTVEQRRYNPQLVSGKLIGGSDFESHDKMAATPDGGYVMVGVSNSDGTGYVRDSHGGGDAWVVKMNSNGDTAWTRLLGGNEYDRFNTVTVSSDGFILLAGETDTDLDGDVRDNHGNTDAWVVKMKMNGDTVWTRLLGGSSADVFFSAAAGTDGSIILGGFTGSADGDGGNIHGGLDSWIVKLDANGNTLWKRIMGGSYYETVHALAVVPDGIVAGCTTTSNNTGDVGQSHGGEGDFWVIKLDNNGNVKWKKLLGGSETESLMAVTAATDGSVVLAGSTDSHESGDVGKGNGGTDIWVVKLKNNGDTAWTRLLGGSRFDEAVDVAVTPDGGYIVAGTSNSENSGDIGKNEGGDDFVIIKLNAYGHKLWSSTLGGFDYDYSKSILVKSNGHYIVSGVSGSDNSGDLAGLHNNGSADWWIVNIRER